MQDELMRYVKGEPVPWRDRKVMANAKQAYDEVRLAAFKVNGVFALGENIMDGAGDLDDHRRNRAGNDPVLNTMLAQIEANALLKAQRIQNDLFGGW